MNPNVGQSRQTPQSPIAPPPLKPAVFTSKEQASLLQMIRQRKTSTEMAMALGGMTRYEDVRSFVFDYWSAVERSTFRTYQ
jgi:hypothetical protein